MRQDQEDGVYMDNTVSIIDEKKGFPISTRIFQFLVITIGGWSGISIFIEALKIPCSTAQVNAAVIVFAGIVFALCLLPSHELVKLFFGLLFYGLFFYSRLARLLNGFYILENLVIARIVSYYRIQNFRFLADYTAKEADTTLLVIMVLIPVVVLLSLAVVKNKLVGLSGLVLLLPVSASFAFGLIPSEQYLVSYVICALYLTRSAYNFRRTVRVRQEQKVMLHRISSRAAAWLSLTGLLLFFAMRLIITREDYNRLTNIKDMKTEIQTAMYSFSLGDITDKINEIRLFTRKSYSTGLDGGKLGGTEQVRYMNTEHLRLTAPLQSIEEGIYLKGYVGSVYTGDRWEGHSEKTQEEYRELLKLLPEELFPTVNQVSLFFNNIIDEYGAGIDRYLSVNTARYDFNICEGNMDIEYEDANERFLYAPYFTNYERMEDILYENDLYAAPALRKKSYEYNYYYNVALESSQVNFYQGSKEISDGDYGKYEKLYRDFVYKAYTVLPEEGLKNIKRDFSPEQVGTAAESVAEKIDYVRNYLEQNTQYSLSPGRLPKGKDFVEYFLYENKVGYCAHYASAATLMLRAMGVPARYVEGYAVGEEAIAGNTGSQEIICHTDRGSETDIVTEAEVSVRDYNAHAWVEVYFDGCGWVPVEFTPGSAVDYNRTVVADMNQVKEKLNEDEAETAIDPEEAAATPTPAADDPEDEENEQSMDRENLPENPSEEEGGPEADAAGLIYFGILAAALVAFGVLFLLFRSRFNNGARNAGGHNKRAIFLYGDIERILISCKGLPKRRALLEESEAYVKEHCSYIDADGFDHMMEIVRKARYGKGRISVRELGEVAQYRNRLYYKVYKGLSFGRRIYLKLILSV